MRLTALGLASAVMFVSTAAWATYDVTNRIRSVDPVRHEVRLADGLYYLFLKDVDLTGFQPGELVTITVHTYNDNQGLLCYAKSITSVQLPKSSAK